jgi:ABC-type Na+ efflux pump permease subunit
MSADATTSKPMERSRAPAFSLLRVWTLATHTMTQLMRMRIVWFLVALCLLVMGAAFVFEKQGIEQQLKQLKVVSLGAMQAASVLFAIASTALLLPRDLEDRTLYTILSKPVPRYEYIIGKLLGVLLLIGGGLLIMDLVLCGVMWIKQSLLIEEGIAALASEQSATPENVAVVREVVAHYGLSWSMHAEVWMTFLRASVVTAMTLLISTFASTTLFTMVTAFGFTVAGYGVQLMRDWFLSGPQAPWQKLLSNVLPMVCPNLSRLDLSEAAAQSLPVPLGLLWSLTGMAALYITVYTAVAYLFFTEKEL